MSTAQSYPLKWPDGWERTRNRHSARYKVTVDRAYEDLVASLQKLGALSGSIIISSNVPPRNAFGTPRNDGAQVGDTGVAIYWQTRAHGERVMACDRWDTVKDNIRAIGLAVEGLRAMERAGASQIMERAFTAFGSLPASANAAPARPWWDVLGFTHSTLSVLSAAVVDARYRELARAAHPDHGGSAEGFAELGRARDAGRCHYGA